LSDRQSTTNLAATPEDSRPARPQRSNLTRRLFAFDVSAAVGGFLHEYVTTSQHRDNRVVGVSMFIIVEPASVAKDAF